MILRRNSSMRFSSALSSISWCRSFSNISRRTCTNLSTSRLCSCCFSLLFCAFICSMRSSSAIFLIISMRNASSSSLYFSLCCSLRYLEYSFACIISSRARMRFSAVSLSACIRRASSSSNCISFISCSSSASCNALARSSSDILASKASLASRSFFFCSACCSSCMRFCSANSTILWFSSSICLFCVRFSSSRSYRYSSMYFCVSLRFFIFSIVICLSSSMI
mmetsp:Transcript_8576/g.14527  ORF Transcript_8576/g.14527 Transcript_8576/m.14527 type:complete len:223 (-) Transcript_8576:297-965(-)